MEVPDKSILLIGESDVGKSHYGGQLLKRLMQEDGRIRMDGAATNLEPFEAVMASLDEGLSAGHTATTTYHESRWPIIDDEGRKADLIWPDYGGEQIKNIIDERRLPHDLAEPHRSILGMAPADSPSEDSCGRRHLLPSARIPEGEQHGSPGSTIVGSGPLDRAAANAGSRSVDVGQAHGPIASSRCSPDVLGRDGGPGETDRRVA